MRLAAAAFVAVALLAAAAAAQGDGALVPGTAPASPASAPSDQVHSEPHHSHWDYKNHGSDWKGKCAEGQKQSPVDFRTVTAVRSTKAETPAHAFTTHYSVIEPVKSKGKAALHLVNNGHALQVDGHFEGQHVMHNNHRYNLKQFHFHAPSEHHIDGKGFDAEMHLVHQKEGSEGTNDLLVIGVLFKKDSSESPEENEFIDSINIANVPTATNGKVEITTPVDLNKNIDAFSNSYWSYQGSLTTPTCDEGVTWFVAQTHQSMTFKQLKHFTDRFAGNAAFANGNGNNRKIQPTNIRKLHLISQ